MTKPTEEVFRPQPVNPLPRLWSSYVEALGFEPCQEIRSDFVTKVRKLIYSKQPIEAIEGALERLARRGQPLRLLHEFVVEYRVRETPRARSRAAAAAHVREHGWPTGARFVRGASGGTGSYKYDPLGYDPLPPGYQGWPYHKPTFEEITEAL